MSIYETLIQKGMHVGDCVVLMDEDTVVWTVDWEGDSFLSVVWVPEGRHAHYGQAKGADRASACEAAMDSFLSSFGKDEDKLAPFDFDLAGRLEPYTNYRYDPAHTEA